MQILGIFNTSRGTDSCGYYYNGNIVKGVDKVANFAAFIQENELIAGDVEGELFMGHTRKSTSGSNSEANAHPHRVGDYVQTHNGVIRNIWTLCNKYNIDAKAIFVDSIGLAHIIQAHGFQVLNEYEGYAALTMHFDGDPKALYIYHGASRDVKAGPLWIERPLFILEQPEGIYYSSIEKSLSLISENKRKPYELPVNTVYKIVDGAFTDFEYAVDRENVNVKPETIGFKSVIPLVSTTTPSAKVKELPFQDSCCSTEKESTTLNLVWRESFPVEFSTNDVYFRHGRHYREANVLLNGKYVIDRDGTILQEGVKSARQSATYYFIRGVMMDSEKSYNNALKEVPDIVTNLTINTAYYLSKYSKYPVAALPEEGTGVSNNLRGFWFKNCKRVTETLHVKFSSRSYEIRNGILMRIKKSIDSDTPYMKSLEGMSANIVDNEDIDLIDSFIGQIKEWFNKKLTKEDAIKIPECVLLFLDYYNNRGGKNLPEAVVELETTTILHDVIKTNTTLREYFRQYFDEYLITDKYIIECFEEYDVDTLVSFTEYNRYDYIDFNLPDGFGENVIVSPTSDEVKKYGDVVQDKQVDYEKDNPSNVEDVTEESPLVIEAEAEIKEIEVEQAKYIIEKCITNMDNLHENCSKLQALDTNDEAQNVAFAGFKAYDTLRDCITSVASKEPFKELNEHLKKNNIC